MDCAIQVMKNKLFSSSESCDDIILSFESLWSEVFLKHKMAIVINTNIKSPSYEIDSIYDYIATLGFLSIYDLGNGHDIDKQTAPTDKVKITDNKVKWLFNLSIQKVNLLKYYRSSSLGTSYGCREQVCMARSDISTQQINQLVKVKQAKK